MSPIKYGNLDKTSRMAYDFSVKQTEREARDMEYPRRVADFRLEQANRTLRAQPSRIVQK